MLGATRHYIEMQGYGAMLYATAHLLALTTMLKEAEHCFIYNGKSYKTAEQGANDDQKTTKSSCLCPSRPQPTSEPASELANIEGPVPSKVNWRVARRGTRVRLRLHKPNIWNVIFGMQQYRTIIKKCMRMMHNLADRRVLVLRACGNAMQTAAFGLLHWATRSPSDKQATADMQTVFNFQDQAARSRQKPGRGKRVDPRLRALVCPSARCPLTGKTLLDVAKACEKELVATLEEEHRLQHMAVRKWFETKRGFLGRCLGEPSTLATVVGHIVESSLPLFPLSLLRAPLPGLKSH